MGVKRVVAIAVSVAALALAPGLWAQRGGGGRSFGGGGRSFGGAHPAGGFSSFHSAPAPVARPAAPGPSAYGSVRQAYGGWRRGPGSGGPGSGRNGGGWRGGRHRYYGYGYGYPYGVGYGFYPYGYYIPSSMSYAGFPDDYAYDQGAYAYDQGAAQAPEDNGPPPYGDEQGYPAGPGYPPPGYGAPGYGNAPRAAAPQAPAEAQLPTVLVYRDGHQMEVQNYAIYNNAVWVFGDQITRKIALADLDVAQTQKLNDQRGVEFDIPESR